MTPTDIENANYIVEMPDGSEYSVPVLVIAWDRARHYAPEFGGDDERSLKEDTLPLFASDAYQIHDWASGNMNWLDVNDHATQITEPTPVDYQDGWVNGRYRLSVRS